MKKLASIALAVLLMGSLNSETVRGQQPKNEEPPVVSIRSGEGPNASTQILRLEYQLRIMASFDPGIVRVHSVSPGGPATKLVSADARKTPGALERGDIITHVDGQRINSWDDYCRAMYLAGGRQGKVTLRVIDVNTGRTFEWDTVAEPVGGGGRFRPRQNAGPAKRVKVLLIGDTNDEKIGSGVAKNLDGIKSFVLGLPNFDPQTDLTVLTGKSATGQNIMDTVKRLRVAQDEALFCYLAGHGAYDERISRGDPAGGHFFQLNGGAPYPEVPPGWAYRLRRTVDGAHHRHVQRGQRLP